MSHQEFTMRMRGRDGARGDENALSKVRFGLHCVPERPKGERTAAQT